VQPSANATAASPGSPTASAWTAPLALVARSLAMEWPSLGLDGREVALNYATRLSVWKANAKNAVPMLNLPAGHIL
jgi:hypothetical protein